MAEECTGCFYLFWDEEESTDEAIIITYRCGKAVQNMHSLRLEKEAGPSNDIISTIKVAKELYDEQIGKSSRPVWCEGYQEE